MSDEFIPDDHRCERCRFFHPHDETGVGHCWLDPPRVQWHPGLGKFVNTVPEVLWESSCAHFDPPHGKTPIAAKVVPLRVIDK